MAKIKVKDKEVEVDDEVAGLVADETGVPFRNRAAEARRKQEKLEKEFSDYKEAQAVRFKELEDKSKAQVQASPYVANPGQPQAYYDPKTNQVFYANQPQSTYNQPGLTAEDARKLAKEELARERMKREYIEETRKFQKEWENYDDEKEDVHDYLREIGYEDSQIKSFGPRDLRLVKDAFKAKKQSKPRNRNPQEIVMDTGGGEGFIESDDSPWKPGFTEKLDKKKFETLVAETKMKPRLGDE